MYIVMGIKSTIKLFADDAKLYRAIKSTDDYVTLKEDLNRLANWSHTWLLKSNAQKCHVMHFGHFNSDLLYNLNDVPLAPTAEEKDL